MRCAALALVLVASPAVHAQETGAGSATVPGDTAASAPASSQPASGEASQPRPVPAPLTTPDNAGAVDQEPGGQDRAANADSGGSGEGEGQQDVPQFNAVPDVDDARGADDAAVSQDSDWLDWLQRNALIAAIIGFLLLAAIIFFTIFRRSAKDQAPMPKRQFSASKYNEGTAGGSSAIVQGLERQIADLHAEIDRLKAELAQARGEAPAAIAGAAIEDGPESFGSVYDRKTERVDLPDDNRGAPPPPERPAEAAPVRNEPSQPVEPVAVANSSREEFHLSQEARELVENFNSGSKQGEYTRLAESAGAQYYTNERSTDVSTLLKSEIDRFWLVPNKQNPDEAFLMPGFNLKKSWQKFRQEASDHPLAHHFDMRRGEKLVVLRPALLRRDSNGWKLVSKGEISGLS